MISIVLAILLPHVLLYGGVFYSGHLFVISISIVLGAWRILSFFGLPFLTLEVAAGHSSIDRRQSLLILAALLAAAIMLDRYMSSRFESDNALENVRRASAVHRDMFFQAGRRDGRYTAIASLTVPGRSGCVAHGGLI
jgi:hypothetical protein